ncbi:MAG: hypothetical protein ACYCX4_07615 [Bacillota bacterium]
MGGVNEGYVIATLEDLPNIKGDNPPASACPAIKELIGNKRKTTDWLGIVLILTFAAIEFIILINGAFKAENLNDIGLLLDKVKDQWGTILGFVLGYYFANRENKDNQDNQL